MYSPSQSVSPYLIRTLKEMKKIRKCLKKLRKKGYKISLKRPLKDKSVSKIRFEN